MKNNSELALDFSRIAISADGNADPDDVGATPAGLAMLAEVGLQDLLVHYHVNSQVWGRAGNPKNQKMRDSAFGSADRMGFDRAEFFDALPEFQADGPNNVVTRDLAADINASSANDQLLIVAAGPMEVIYQAVKLANPNKRDFVKVLTHSSANDNNTGDGSGHTRSDIEKLGVEFIDIRDQNRGFSTHKDFGPWSWMKNSDANWQWVYQRMQAGSKADISDAGMVYYALTGDENGDISKLRSFINSGPNPRPEPPTPEPEPEPQPQPNPPSSQSLVKVSLVDATTDEVIKGYENLGSNSQIDLNKLNASEFTLIAQVNPNHPNADSVRSIKFESSLGDRTENTAPYSFFGDSNGDLLGQAFSKGSYTFQATAYTQKGGKGTAIFTADADYTVIGTSGLPPSNPSPPSPPPSGSQQLKVKGSNGNDVLIGSAQNQKILGLAGNDQIKAGNGDDIAYGGKGDDVLFGQRGNDTISGSKGSDTLIGVAVEDAKPGIGEQDVLAGGSESDLYVLGDESRAYYDDGNANSSGEIDFAFIKDFKQNQGDKIQLHGEADDYRLGNSSQGDSNDVGIFLKTSGQDELVAVVNNANNLNLEDSAIFSFVN